MALQEAVAHRLPILALDRGNVGFHVENGQNGNLCATIPALVAQLKQWTGSRDFFLKKVAGAQAHQSKVVFGWQKAAERFADFVV